MKSARKEIRPQERKLKFNIRWVELESKRRENINMVFVFSQENVKIILIIHVSYGIYGLTLNK